MPTKQTRTSLTPDRIISSRHAPFVERLRLLQTAQGRRKTGLFLVEGIRHIAQAVQHGVTIETLLLAPKALNNIFGLKLVRHLRIQGVSCVSLTPEVYFSLSLAEDPQGIAAVVRQRWERLDQIRPEKGLCWVAVESLRSAGNLGTIIRTSEAVGGAGVISLGESADPYDPAALRASMGALFAQRFVRATPQEFANWKRHSRYHLVGTSPSAHQDYRAARYPKPCVLLMGSERTGLSEELRTLCDLNVRIPMVGTADSLNVAVATGVLLYEIYHQRNGPTSAP